MTTPADLPSLQVLLNAVSARIDAVGLRPVAREIGLDPKSVVQLLEGARPRRSTRQKLEAWYVRTVATEADAQDVATAVSAVSVLARDFAEPHRSRVIAHLLETLREDYSQAGFSIPDWLARVEELFRKGHSEK